MASSETGQRPWIAQGAEKRVAVRDMFAEIAPIYDKLNGMMSLKRHHRWRRIAAETLHLKPGDTVLDLCCGTGDFAAPLRNFIGSGGTLVAADFCLPMLELAAHKPGMDEGPSILTLSDACRLPFGSKGFDAVAVGWGIRNVAEPAKAFEEIVRVLRPGGRFVSVDMAVPRNSIFRFGCRIVNRFLLPFLGKIFKAQKAYTYLPESAERFLTRDALKEKMAEAGFVDVAWRDLFFGAICMHMGRKP